MARTLPHRVGKDQHSWINIGVDRSTKQCVTCGVIKTHRTVQGKQVSSFFLRNKELVENPNCKKL
jgi:hypothetical protein